jgi:hypothetical protein
MNKLTIVFLLFTLALNPINSLDLESYNLSLIIKDGLVIDNISRTENELIFNLAYFLAIVEVQNEIRDYVYRWGVYSFELKKEWITEYMLSTQKEEKIIKMIGG